MVIHLFLLLYITSDLNFKLSLSDVEIDTAVKQKVILSEPRKISWTKSEKVVWAAAILADSYTTYSGLHNKNCYEKNPLYSNFNSETELVEIVAQMAVIDLLIQYIMTKLIKKKVVKVHTIVHGLAASWNFSKFK